MRLCRKCNVYYEDPELRFCSQCGTTLEEVNICPKCHAENELDFAFCVKCGTKLNGNSVGESTPNNIVPNIQTTQTTAPVQTSTPTNVEKKSVPVQTSTSSQINEDTTSKETSHTNWKMIISVIVIVVGVILALNKDSIDLYLKYSDANNAFKREDYDVAVQKFSELGDYKDSKALLYSAMAAYVNKHMYKDSKTCVFLKKLMESKPLETEWQAKYKELFGWKVKILNVNKSEDDFSQSDNRSFSSGSANNYLHFAVEGGEPYSITRLTYKWISGNYNYNGDMGRANYIADGYKSWIHFDYYREDIAVTFYDDDKNEIGHVILQAR